MMSKELYIAKCKVEMDALENAIKVYEVLLPIVVKAVGKKPTKRIQTSMDKLGYRIGFNRSNWMDNQIEFHVYYNKVVMYTETYNTRENCMYSDMYRDCYTWIKLDSEGCMPTEAIEQIEKHIVTCKVRHESIRQSSYMSRMDEMESSYEGIKSTIHKFNESLIGLERQRYEVANIY